MRNEYENDLFFAQYAQTSRSREGLSAAGEWHQLRLLLPNLKDELRRPMMLPVRAKVLK